MAEARATRPADYGAPIAVAVTWVAAIAAAVAVLTVPPELWLRFGTLAPSVPLEGTKLGPGVPPGLGSVAAGAVLALAGMRLMATAEDAAFAVLALACVLAGVGTHEAVRALSGGTIGLLAPADLDADAGVRLRLFIAYLDLFALSLLVTGIWAAAPKRALGRWVGPVAGLALLLTIGSAAVRASRLGPESGGSGVDLSAIWRSGLLLAAVWLLGAAGSLRAAGLEYLAAGRPADAGPARAGSSLLMGTAVGATAAGVVAVLARSLAVGDLALVAGPLLWLLIALVSLRWSTTAAWMAMTVSLTMAAGVALDVSVVAAWALLVAATLAGWSALVAATGASAARRGRGAALIVAVVTALPLLGGAAGAGLVALVWTPAHGFPLDGLWTPALAFGPLAFAGLIVLRRRLVPAIGEAEVMAGEPFEPSRYLAVLASEALTSQARVRASAAEAERRRLASELHAGVLPGLARAAAETDAGAAPDAVRARLRAVESEVRGLLAERRHVVLEELGLVEALEWLADRAQDDSDLDTSVEVDPATTDDRPPLAVERAAFRVAQLAVDNAVRHAAAGTLSIAVLATPRAIRIVVVDDGRGFQASAASTGFGLSDMRLQAAEAGGRVDVASTPGEGTRVTFIWPR